MRFANLMRSKSANGPGPADTSNETLTVNVAKTDLTVAVRRSSRARRLTLTLDRCSGNPVLTLPLHVKLDEAQNFLDRHATWIEKQRAKLPEAQPFRHGASIPIRDELHTIIHQPGRGTVEAQPLEDGPVIVVPGDIRHLERRLTDWLKTESRRDFQSAVSLCSKRLGLAPKRIRIGDPKSRWGSCSSNGTLSFSWRLILAPPNVLFYLAAHETAHLKEMNHSADFWRLVEHLDPDYRIAQLWLKRHGPSLQRIGGSGQITDIQVSKTIE